MRIEMLNGSMNGRAIGLVAACGMMGSFAGEASAQEVPVLDENSVLFVARIPGTPNYGTFAMQIDPVNGAVTPPELFPGDIFRPGPQANPSRVPFAFPDSIYLRKRPGRTKYTSVTLASRSIVGVNIDIEKGVEFVFERSMPDLMNSFINGGGADVLPEEFLSGELLFPGEMHTPVLLESREDIQNDIDGWGDAEFRIGSGGGGGGRIAIVAWKELDKASPALASAFIGPTVAEGGPAFADLIGGSPTTPQTAALLGITPRSTKYLDKSSPAIFHGVTGPDGPTFGSLPLPAFAGPVDEVVSGSQGVYMYEAPTEAGDLGTLWLLDLNGEVTPVSQENPLFQSSANVGTSAIFEGDARGVSGVTDVVFLSFRETNNSPGQIVMVVPGVSEPVVIAEGGDLFEDPIAVFGINGPEIEAPSFCPNDIDGDDDIDVFDLIAFLQAFTPTSDCPANPNCAVADLERDGDIDVFDLITFLQGFKPGRCPGAA